MILAHTRARDQVLQSPEPYFDAIAVSLLEHREEVEHVLEVGVAHVFLADQQAHGRPTRQAPVPNVQHSYYLMRALIPRKVIHI